MFIPGTEFIRSWKLADWFWLCGQAGEAVEFNEKMAVGGENKFDVMATAFGVAFGLIESVTGGKALFFCFEKSKSYRLGVIVDFQTEDIIDLSA